MPQIILPVPASVTSHYVIVTNKPVEDPYTVVPWRVSQPFRKASMEAMNAPRLSIYSLEAAETRWRFDRFLAGEDDRRRIEEASHHMVLIHEALTSEQPFREQAARAVARALASATDGILVDPQARLIVLRDGLAANERERFRMGDQWFGVEYDVNDRDRSLDPKVCRCVRLTLRGLRRFGLPDLVIDGIACAYDLAAVNLLRSVASHLLTLRWDERGRVVDDHVKVDPSDFWRYWAATPLARTEPLVARFRLTGAGMIEVLPPEDFAGSMAEWISGVVVQAMPPLIGCPADEDMRPQSQTTKERA